jgi:phosphonate transport system substrate-binding protein
VSCVAFIFILGACTPDDLQKDGILNVYPWAGPHIDFPKVLTLGVVPQQPPAHIERRWGPLTEYLEAELGITVLVKTASSIPTFEERCVEGRYDLAYMNPYHYVVFSEEAGYWAFALQKNKRIKGIMVMRKDRKDQSLKSLGGSTLAFPSPAAFAASLLTRAHLKSINVDFKPTYVRSHDSVYKAVAEGLYPAGGGVKRTFASTDPEVRSQLEIAWTTKPFTPHALAAHPRVPQQLVSQIQEALIRLGSREENPKILKPINFNGFAAASHKDWDDVRALGLTALDPKRSQAKALIKTKDQHNDK